jgi:hypothetical protein
MALFTTCRYKNCYFEIFAEQLVGYLIWGNYKVGLK